MDTSPTKLQDILLDILKEIIRVCEVHAIPYYLVEGSCLGAVRHKGFIPWDDDLDIAIPFSYLESFVDACKLELNSRYAVVPPFEEGSEELMKVIDTQTLITGGISRAANVLHPWVDVFILCGMPSNPLRRLLHYHQITFAHKFFKFRNPERIRERKRSILQSGVVRIAEMLNRSARSSDASNRDLQALKRAMARYSSEDGAYLYCLSWYGAKEIMPSSIYGEGKKVPFENMQVVVPARAEEYLERLYGDWKQLPPESKRSGKHCLTLVE